MSAGKFLRTIEKIVDFLFPTDIKCMFCDEEIKKPNKFHACENCLKNLPYNNEKICKICGSKIIDLGDLCPHCKNKLPSFEIARSPFIYAEPISSKIIDFKFSNAKYLFEPLGEFLVDTYEKFNYDADLIIPVPLSQEREKTRKYNQATELSRPLSKKYNLPICEDLVQRVRDTMPQARLAHFKREQNIKKAFKLKNKNAVAGKNILIIDDVMTTGETLKSLCNEIQKGHPKTIYVLTLAHTFFGKKILKNTENKFTRFNDNINSIKFKIKLKKKLDLIAKINQINKNF